MKTPVRVAIAFGLIAAAMLLGCKEAAERHHAAQPRSTYVEPIRQPQSTPDVDVGHPAPEDEAAAGKAAAVRHTGYVPHPLQAERFLKSLPQPTLRQAAPHFFEARGPPAPSIQAASDKRPVLLYRALDEAHRRKFGKPFLVGAQQIGDCTSWATAHAVDVVLAIDYLEGRSGDFQMVASESCYGLGRVEGAGRTYTGGGDGSYGAAMVAGLTKFGVCFRFDYTAVASPECDLRLYSGKRAKSWGAWGNGGRDDRGRLDAIARQHPIQQVALVTTQPEVEAALENGYPIIVCSGQGFADWTDANGIARPSGHWSHAMCVVGLRYDIACVLILNSWGPDWLDQSRGVFPSDQPRGAFWCPMATFLRMIGGRDSYAVSSLVGFPRQELRIVKGL